MTGNTHVIERNETHDMISSDKVEGTALYGRDGQQLGTVHHLMIGKRDGRVRHAVISYGGFLGIGEDYYPMPWNELSYDQQRGGYMVDRDAEQLKGGPRYRLDQQPSWDLAFEDRLTSYYR